MGGNPINTKTACIEAVFKNGAACCATIGEENYDEYRQLEYKLKRFSDYDEDMNAKDLQLKILDI